MSKNNPDHRFNFLTKGVYHRNPDLITYSSANKSAVAIPGSGYDENRERTYLYSANLSGDVTKLLCPGRFAELLTDDEKLEFALIFDELILGH